MNKTPKWAHIVMIIFYLLLFSFICNAQDTIQIKAERNAVKTHYTLEQVSVDDSLCNAQNAVLRSDNDIWRAKYESKSNLADSTAYLLNNSIQDGINMDKNYRKDIKNIKMANKIKDVILDILVPVVIGESIVLYLKR